MLRHSAVWLSRRVRQVRHPRLLRLQGRTPGAARRVAFTAPTTRAQGACARLLRRPLTRGCTAWLHLPQAYSHRCKSLGMSTFEAAEVEALSRAGNAAAAKTWLGRLTREQICAMAPAKTAPAKARIRRP